MQGDGRGEDDDTHGSGEQREDVDVALQVGEDREALLERDRQQEGEQDLDAGLGDAQLLQLLPEVAIDPLRPPARRGCSAGLSLMPHEYPRAGSR